MTAEETRTRRRTFQRARRAAVGYRSGFSVTAALGRSLVILVCRFPRLAVAALPAYLAACAPSVYLADLSALPNPATLVALLVFAAIAFHLLVGFLAGAIGDDLEGERTGVVACVAAGSRSLLTTIGLAAALGFVVALGTVIAVLPGVVIGLATYTAIPVAAREGIRPWAAVKRSARLALRSTDVFGCLLLLGLSSPIVQAIAFGSILPPGSGDPATLAGLARESTYFLPFLLTAILPTAVHHELTKR